MWSPRRRREDHGRGHRRATIVRADTNPARLTAARELGATHTVDPADEDAGDAIRRIVAEGVDASLECTASPDVFRRAVECTAPTGVCGILANGRTEERHDPLHRESRLLPERHQPGQELGYDFDEIDRAAHDAEAGRVIKPVLRMGTAA